MLPTLRPHQQQNLDEVRSHVISSDEDIVPAISLPAPRQKPKSNDVRTLATPRDMVGLIKPRHQAKPQIIMSDGEQQATRVDTARTEHVIMAQKDNASWDVKDAGSLQSRIAKVISDKSIERNDQIGRASCRERV